MKHEQEKVNLKIRCAGQPSPKKRKEYRDKKAKEGAVISAIIMLMEKLI